MRNEPTVSRVRFCVTSASVLGALLAASVLLLRRMLHSVKLECDVNPDTGCIFAEALTGLFYGAIFFAGSMATWVYVLVLLRRRWYPTAKRLWIVPLLALPFLGLGGALSFSGDGDPRWGMIVVAGVLAPMFATWSWLATRPSPAAAPPISGE